MEFLQHLFSVIPTPDSSTAATLAVGAEILMRYVPSQKPLSVIHAISEGCHVIGDGLGKVASLMDRLFGQNTKS